MMTFGRLNVWLTVSRLRVEFVGHRALTTDSRSRLTFKRLDEWCGYDF